MSKEKRKYCDFTEKNEDDDDHGFSHGDWGFKFEDDESGGKPDECPFLNKSDFLRTCPNCNQLILNPLNHIFYDPNDDTISSHQRPESHGCQSDGENVDICNRCGHPSKINGYRIGIHTDGPESCSNDGRWMTEETYRERFERVCSPTHFEDCGITSDVLHNRTEHQECGFAIVGGSEESSGDDSYRFQGHLRHCSICKCEVYHPYGDIDDYYCSIHSRHDHSWQD